jgi:thiol-disulfide isomerase/thioredoxin
MNRHPWLFLVLVIVAGCTQEPPPDRPSAEVTAPLTVLAMNGEELDLDATLAGGQTVALVFWQTWCGSCKGEAPEIVEAVRAHGSRIRFVGVVAGRDEDVDDAEVSEVATAWGYGAFPQVRDRDLAWSNRFGVRATPTIVVLGKGRRVLFNGHRAPESWTTLRGAPEKAR